MMTYVTQDTERMDNALVFFQNLFEDLTENEYIELLALNHHETPTAVRQHFVQTTDEALHYARQMRDGGWDIYMGPAPRAYAKSGKKSVHTTRWLWADIDEEGLEAKSDTYLTLPPTMVLRSGKGVHVYWRLRNTIAAQMAENTHAMMVDAIGADVASKEYSHKMRVPDTYNFKYGEPLPVTLDYENSHFDVEYDIEDVQGFMRLLSNSKVGKVVADLIRDPQYDITKKQSMSDLDWKLTCYMVNPDLTGTDEGLSDDCILTIYANTSWGDRAALGEKEKHPRYMTEYTLPKARDHVAMSKSRAASPFTVRNGQLFYQDDLLASFWLEPVALLHMDDNSEDVLLCNVHTGNAEYPNTPFPRSAFTSVRSLNSSQVLTNASCVWYSTSDYTLRLYLNHLWQQVVDQGLPEYKATNCYGRYGDLWVTSDFVLSADGIIPKGQEKVIYVRNERYVPPMRYTFDERELDIVAREVNRLIGDVNMPGIIWPALGWIMACPRKASLAEQDIHFPFLHVFGQQGSGKSRLFEGILLPLAGHANPSTFGVADFSSQFRLMWLLSATNGVPLVFDEFRVATTPQQVLAMLRSLYDGSEAFRGRPDQSVTHYRLQAPTVIVGEDLIEDPALKERAIILNPNRAFIMDRGRDGRPTRAYQSFYTLAGMNLQAWAGPYVQYCLATPDRYEVAKKVVDAAYPMMLGDRLRNNITVCVLGLMSYVDFLRSIGIQPNIDPWEPTWISQVFMSAVGEVVNIHTGYSPSNCDEFVQDVLTFIAVDAERAHREFLFFYDERDQTVSLNLESSYIWWVKQRRQAGLPHWGKPAIQRQLAMKLYQADDPQLGNYVLASGVNKRFGGGKQARVYQISLQKAQEAGLDVPTDLSESQFPPLGITFMQAEAVAG